METAICGDGHWLHGIGRACCLVALADNRLAGDGRDSPNPRANLAADSHRWVSETHTIVPAKAVTMHDDSPRLMAPLVQGADLQDFGARVD